MEEKYVGVDAFIDFFTESSTKLHLRVKFPFLLPDAAPNMIGFWLGFFTAAFFLGRERDDE